MNFDTDFFRTHYRLILGLLLLLSLGSSITVNALLLDVPKTNFDTSFYQHAGWYITHHGAIPYVEIWSVKPPVHFYIQIILGLVSGGDMLVLHWLNIIGSSVAVAGTVYFTAEFLINLTGKKIAGLVGGLGILSLPHFYIYASMGFRSKLYVVCLGMAAMYLQSQKRSFLSGVLSSIALGLWQFGIIFPLMSLLYTCRSTGANFRRTLLGILSGGLLVLLPVFYWGAFPAMVAEAIVIPLIMGESLQLLKRVTQLLIWPNFTFGPLFLGFIWCFVYGWKTSFRKGAWFVVGFLLVLVQCLLVDLDGIADSFVLLVFVSLGLGYLARSLRPGHANIGVVLMVILLVANGAWELNQFREVEYEYPNYVTRDMSIGGEQKTIRFDLERWQTKKFWNKYVPDSCHYRMSVDEFNWIDRTPQGIKEKRCGKWSTLNAYFSSQNE